jgi:hypothetical protein
MVLNAGKRGRPRRTPDGTISITIRMDADIIGKIRSLSADTMPYQALINELLRRYLDYCSPLAIPKADQATIDTETFFLRTAPFLSLSSVQTPKGEIILGASDKVELRLSLLINILCEQLSQSRDVGDRRQKKNNQNSLYILRRAGETLKSLRNRCDTFSVDLLSIYDIRARWVYEAMKSLQKAIDHEALSVEQSIEKVKINDIAEEILTLTRIRYLDGPIAEVAQRITDYIFRVAGSKKNRPVRFKLEDISKEDMKEKFELAIKRLRKK